MYISDIYQYILLISFLFLYFFNCQKIQSNSYGVPKASSLYEKNRAGRDMLKSMAFLWPFWVAFHGLLLPPQVSEEYGCLREAY